jgi:electron transfer flavoprotein-quinone oxidoreductase
MMPQLTGEGLLVAGDAAAMCLAAGIWLEGVNFAMASGMAAAETAAEAVAAGDVSRRGLAGYEKRLNSSFVLADHNKLSRIPGLVLSDRVQHQYPQMIANVVERVFRVDNPNPKPGLRKIFSQERKRAGVRLRDLARDGWTGMRGFG